MKHNDSQHRAQFEKVLSEYRGRLGRIAQTYADRDSDDLMQEILLQIWRSLPCFEGKSSIGTWCYRIAINTAISWKRKASRRHIERVSKDLDQHPATNSRAALHELGLLQRFLTTLGDIDQAVLVMHLDNVDHDDIADALGVTAGAIRTRMSRLRRKLASWDSPSSPADAHPTFPQKEGADG